MDFPRIPFSHLVDHAHFSFAHRVRYPRAHTGFRAPCLILLHDDHADEMQLAEVGFDLDEQLLVVLARAPITVPNGGFMWAREDILGRPVAAEGMESEGVRQALLRFLDELAQAYAIDRRQIFMAGFGRGGALSASVALTRPDRVAAFGLLSGLIPSDIRPLLAGKEELSKLGAFVTHGREDLLLPVEFARDSLHMLMSRAVQTGYREYEFAGHELTEAMKQGFADWLSVRIRMRQGL